MGDPTAMWCAGHVLHDGMLHDDMDDDEFVTFEELLQQFKDEDEVSQWP